MEAVIYLDTHVLAWLSRRSTNDGRAIRSTA